LVLFLCSTTLTPLVGRHHTLPGEAEACTSWHPPQQIRNNFPYLLAIRVSVL
jgi:hypothetical protein